MKTTININDDLLREAKVAAAASGQTLTELFTDALRHALALRKQGEGRKTLPLFTFKGDGVLPGVDLTDSSALLDLMEEGLDAVSRR